MAILTFTSDFGWRDSYVAQMKGVALSIAPSLQIVDLSHDIPPFDINCGAAFLRDCTPVFPDGSVHVAVIDPGVGTDRRRIIAEIEHKNGVRGLFVGPDNGLFSQVAHAGSIRNLFEIQDSELLPKFQGATFDGRSYFAPTGAHLAAGVRPAELGVGIDVRSLQHLPAPRPPIFSAERPSSILAVHGGEELTVKTSPVLRGVVVRFDRFGNAETNIRADLLPVNLAEVRVQVASFTLRAVHTFADLAENVPGAIINSSGHLELVVRERNASEVMRLTVGQPVRVEW